MNTEIIAAGSALHGSLCLTTGSGRLAPEQRNSIPLYLTLEVHRGRALSILSRHNTWGYQFPPISHPRSDHVRD